MVVLLAIIFQFLTVPVSAHMIARSAYIRGVKLWEGSIIDQLRERYSTSHHFLKALQETDDE
jgi:multicomponent Na+:H+ antiporter subunit G